MTHLNNTQNLNNISETMLITVWARAIETQQQKGLIYDPFAVDTIKKIDYDFSVFNKATMSQAGCCIRSKLIDNQTLEFIHQHPDAVIIQLGAGLDSRLQRLQLQNHDILANITHWYDLDLAEAISIRKALCPPHPKNSLLEMSLFDDNWIEIVQTHNKPTLIIIEGVLMYFEEDAVKSLFDKLCQRFKTTTILMDMLAYSAKGNAKHHDTLKHTKQKTEFKWSLLNSKDMEEWHNKIHLTEELYMSDYAGKRFPWWMRLLYKTPYGYKHLNQRILRIDIS
ncbi:MAG: methyltransferase [Gammaproteobacteria bacterium]|nr:MAG: methyltransferase [Gammaproteobacteria bacterium]